ncbi:hypothetical protein BRADI_2g55901v3 [Brachypodium distachyon]|uniref:Uncharacterized protein n=1 Tax=Brachypodium distachyon TaxID=15368 RepID=A0A0Q3GJY7_BRADI|nr:hypothetical protein BRADI_2g55901v3 [Brachypodium distachyon]
MCCQFAYFIAPGNRRVLNAVRQHPPVDLPPRTIKGDSYRVILCLCPSSLILLLKFLSLNPCTSRAMAVFLHRPSPSLLKVSSLRSSVPRLLGPGNSCNCPLYL